MSYLEGLTNEDRISDINALTINGRELDDNAKNRMIIFWNLLLRNNNNDVNEATQSLFACLAEAVDLENEININILNDCIASEEAVANGPIMPLHGPTTPLPGIPSPIYESPSPISMHDSMSSYPSLESLSPLSMNEIMSSYSSPEMPFVPIYESPSPISINSSMPAFSSFSTLSLSPSSQELPIRQRTVRRRTVRRRPVRRRTVRSRPVRRRTNRRRTIRRRRTNRRN